MKAKRKRSKCRRRYGGNFDGFYVEVAFLQGILFSRSLNTPREGIFKVFFVSFFVRSQRKKESRPAIQGEARGDYAVRCHGAR